MKSRRMVGAGTCPCARDLNAGARVKRTAALVLACGTFIGISAAAVAAAPSARPDRSPVAATQPFDLAKAQEAMDAGRLVEAREIILDAAKNNQLAVAPEEVRTRAMEMLKALEVSISSANPIEISLQQAELALDQGNLSIVDMYLQQLENLGPDVFVPMDLDSRIAEVAAKLDQRREELRPLVRGALDQVVADLNAHRFAEAKSTLHSIVNSGIRLAPADTALIERYLDRIATVEEASGSPFPLLDTNANLAVFQPGTVRRTDDSGTVAASDQPVTVSDPQPMGDQPPPANQSEPDQFVAPPPPAPPPQTPPPTNTNDVVSQAMRVQGQQMLAQADLAFEQQRYSEALRLYNEVAASYGQYLDAADMQRAQQRRDESRVRLAQVAGQPIGQGAITSQTLLRQQAQAEFDNALANAQAALQAGDTTAAAEQVAQARFVIRRAQTAFNEQEIAAHNAQADAIASQIEEASARISRAEAAQREDQLRKALQESERVQRAQTQQKIAEKIQRIRSLQAEQKYHEALDVVDELLFLDERNPTGLLLRDALRALVLYEDYNQAVDEKNFSVAKESLDNERAITPPIGLVDYPKDWPAKTFNRGSLSSYADDPADRRTLATIQNAEFPVDFRDNRLADVFDFVGKLTNVDMDVDWDSLREAGIDPDDPVTLKISKAPADVILDRVLDKVGDQYVGGADWAVENGILVVASEATLRKRRTLVIYNILDLLLDVPNYTEAPQIDLQSVLQQSQGGGGGGGQSPFRDDEDDEEVDRPTREEKVNNLIDIIVANVDTEGWDARGGTTGSIQELNGSLIITNTPKNHRAIEGLLSKLREQRSMQINVETKFLLVNQDWFEQIGFDLDIVFNANNNQVRAAQAIAPQTRPSNFFDFTEGGGYLGGPFVPDSADVNQSNTVGDVANEGSVPLFGQRPRGFSPVAGQQNSLGLASALVPTEGIAATVLNNAPALGIAGEFLDDVQVDFLIQATQADRRTVTLTAPRLTFTNGQTSNIFVVTQRAFVSQLTPVVGTSAVGFDPQVSVASEGVVMLVEGIISADRRYVQMNVDSSIGRIDGFAEQAVSAIAGGQLVSSADTQSFIQLPTITVTRVRTTVTVPDEGTILLGGQRLINELEVETGVPVLSKLPIINRFFTNRIESKEEQTLLILIKPTVLIQSEQEEKAYPGVNDALRSGIPGLQ